MKLVKISLAAIVGLIVIAVGVIVWQLRDMQVEKLTDDLYVLRGAGGNVAVLRTDEGAVVVDTMTFPLQGSRINDLAEELTGKPPILLINTHYHLDHTHGNPAFAPGTRVVATERTLSHLQVLDADFWADDVDLLPNETFTDVLSLEVGGKRLELMHPGRGHTDGDLVVLFADEGFVHMGDLLFNDHYPNIDLEAGGSIAEWPATLDRVAELSFGGVIPGHGATTDHAGIRRFRVMLVQLGEITEQTKADGLSLAQVQATTSFTADAGFEPITMLGFEIGLDRQFVLSRAWDEATGNVELLNPPEAAGGD